jgi:hypothetical protein
MKVALMLSGLPRKVNEGYSATWKHIIQNYDTDVYLHAWKDEEWEKVSETYTNVKSLQIQEPFKFTQFKEGISLPHRDTSRPLPQYDVMSCFRQFPMVYSWQKVYQSLYDTNISYDLIIRSRYDLGIRYPINLNALDGNNVNHGTGGGYYDDNLCITNQLNSKLLFHNVFYKLIEYSRQTGILNSAEASWTTILERAKLIDKAIPNSQLQFVLLRDNLIWWGDENGNIISNRIPC